MPQLDIPREYLTGQTPTSGNFQAAFAAFEAFVNSTGIDSENLTSGAITTSIIADAGISSSDLASGAITTAKIANSTIESSKFASASLGLAKMATRSVTTNGSDAGSGGLTQCASSGAFSGSATSFTTITDQSATLTVTGRPVVFMAEAASSTDPCGFIAVGKPNGNPEATSTFNLYLDSSTNTEVGNIGVYEYDSAITDLQIGCPLGFLAILEAPAATKTVSLQYKCTSPIAAGEVTNVRYSRLAVWEM